jgi:hypothetical protein
MAEGLGLGYLTTGVIVAGVIAMTALAWRLRLNSVLSFWIIYIMTRPLGASIGDFLSQTKTHGGVGLGATMTSFIFLAGILVIVAYLTITKRDVIAAAGAAHTDESKERGGLLQTIIILVLFIVVGGVGYDLRHTALISIASISETSSTTAASSSQQKTVFNSPLGDLTMFRAITQDTLDLLNKADQSGATTRIGDLEYEWDNAQSRLKSKDEIAWTTIDGKIDTVLRVLRAVHPDVASEKAALEALQSALN